MPDQKKNNTQVLELLRKMVAADAVMIGQLEGINRRLTWIRDCCIFLVVVIVIPLVVLVWLAFQYVATMPIEQY